MTQKTLPEEQRLIRDRCYHPSGTFVEFKRDDVEQSIPARFERIVARYPDRLAVQSETQTLTYEELNACANSVADAILNRVGGKKKTIAFLMERGKEGRAKKPEGLLRTIYGRCSLKKNG